MIKEFDLPHRMVCIVCIGVNICITQCLIFHLAGHRRFVINICMVCIGMYDACLFQWALHSAIVWFGCISLLIVGFKDRIWGGADGRVVKVLDSQPRDGGFKSRHTLGLLCLKSLGEICTLNVP